MVRVLIDLRATILRHNAGRMATGWLVVALAVGLVSAGGTLALGVEGYHRAGAGADVLALVFALWFLGRVSQAALAGGDTTMPPELFALLPIPRRRLARALLIVNLLDPSLVLIAVAFSAVIALGVRAGVGAAAVGVMAVVLSTLLVGVASTVAGGTLGPGSRRGHDTGTIVVAVAMSGVAVTGAVLPALIPVLTGRTSPTFTVIVRLLPSGWGPVAVDAASRSDWPMVAVPLISLIALSALVVLAWPAVLSRRMEGATTPPRAAPRRRRRRAVLPRTATGGVVGKELRLWARDPNRLTCLLIAAIVGAAACAIPHATTGTDVLLPFAGALTVVIAGACATNLYGSDGTSLWLTVTTPDSAGPDVRGRQAAWLLIVAPYTIVITVVFTAVSGQRWAWPWVLAGLPALLGGAAGLAAYGSLISVQPLDETGGFTPAISAKIQVALYAVALTATPPVLLLAAGTLSHQDWLRWTAVPVGVACALVGIRGLGAAAVRRLQRQQVTILQRLVNSTSPP